MKKNKYDDERFFEKYSLMSRSVQGLQGAEEWHELKKMLPEPQPQNEHLITVPEMKDELRRSMMLLVFASKKE